MIFSSLKVPPHKILNKGKKINFTGREPADTTLINGSKEDSAVMTNHLHYLTECKNAASTLIFPPKMHNLNRSIRKEQTNPH